MIAVKQGYSMIMCCCRYSGTSAVVRLLVASEHDFDGETVPEEEQHRQAVLFMLERHASHGWRHLPLDFSLFASTML